MTATDSENLDTLLSRPLTVADDGFSARVAVRIRLFWLAQQAMLWIAAATMLVIAGLFVPVAPAAAALVAVMSRTLASPTVTIAIGLAMLAWAWEPRALRL